MPKSELEISIERLMKISSDLKKTLQKKHLTEVQYLILKEINRRPCGERSIYIETNTRFSIRNELQHLIYASYIIRDKKTRKYEITEEGDIKLKYTEKIIEIQRLNKRKNLRIEQRKKLRKWKNDLVVFRKRQERYIILLKRIRDSIDPKTIKAYENNRFLYKEHSRWIVVDDPVGLKKMKRIDELKKKIGKLNSDIYVTENAIKRVQVNLRKK